MTFRKLETTRNTSQYIFNFNKKAIMIHQLMISKFVCFKNWKLSPIALLHKGTLVNVGIMRDVFDFANLGKNDKKTDPMSVTE